jgi:hypothetical protein
MGMVQQQHWPGDMRSLASLLLPEGIWLSAVWLFLDNALVTAIAAPARSMAVMPVGY